MFLGHDRFEKFTSAIAYNATAEPKDCFAAFRDALRLLDKSVVACRSHPGDPKDKRRDAALNMLLGYSLLAMSEGRALIALLSIGLERSSRIHFRSLHEYAFRAALLVEDPAIAHAFKISAAREMQRFLDVFGIPDSDPRVVAAKARYLADADSGEAPQREKGALGGDMASLMRAKSGDDKRYLTTFGQPSLFSHGSILALYEVSEATTGKGPDVVPYVVADGSAATMLLASATQLLDLALRLVRYFGVEVLDEWDAIKARIDKLAGLIAP
jgi:hypothetical protein